MHHVIYVPGLGSGEDEGQRKLVARWQRYDVDPRFYAMHWQSGSFDEKFDGLLALIDELRGKGTVSLVGVSAGASTALLAFAARPKKVTGVAVICGKINHPEEVDDSYYRENPALKASFERLQAVLPQLDKTRILVRRPLWDGVVPVRDMIIPSAPQKILPTVGHAFSIAVAIVFASGMIRFLKQKRVD